MALNFGVKPQKPAVAGPAPSMEELFDAYMDVESVVRATDLFLQKGQQIEDAFENLCIVGSALKKHASAEGLAVVKDIVRNELGVEVSVEAFKEKAKAALEAIKAFFAKIGVWIKEFFAKIFLWVSRAEKRLDNEIAAVRALPDDATLKWTYKGQDFVSDFTRKSSPDEWAKNYANLLAGDASSASNLSEWKAKEVDNANKRAATTRTVSGKMETLNVLRLAKFYLGVIPKYKAAIEAKYKEVSNEIKNPKENARYLENLKDTQKRMKVAVSVAKKECAELTRTIASIIVHFPVKPTNKK